MNIKVVLAEKIADLLHLKPLIIIATLLLLAVLLFIVARKVKFNVRMISYGGICIAAAFILSFLKLFSLPNGGTITVASMLPLLLFAFIAGPRAGIIAGLIYGLLQFIQEPYFLHPIQFLLDYPLPFAMLGLAGLFRNNIWLGSAVGVFGRFVCHFFAGVVFYAEYAGEQNVMLYSLIYNGSYLVPDLAICILFLTIPSVRIIIRKLTTEGQLKLS